MLEVKETILPELWSVKLEQSVDYRGAYMTFFADDLLRQVDKNRQGVL